MAQERRKHLDEASARPSISAHPAFPLIVALWFAALFGLGTAVMPAAMLEKAATHTGLSAVWPTAQPPLSAAARAALALLATILGLVSGLVLARWVANLHATEPAPRRRTPAARAASPARRPISAHEELGEDAIPTPDEAPPPLISGRRRALAVPEEERPSDFLMTAPLPGIDAPLTFEPPADEDEMTDRPIEPDAQPETHETPTFADEALSAPAAPSRQPPSGAQVFAPSEEEAPPEALAPERIAQAAYVPEFDTRKPRATAAPSAALPPALQVDPAERTLDDLGMVQLLERLGRSLQERAHAPSAAPSPQSEPAPAPRPEPPETFQTRPVAVRSRGLASDGESIAVPPPVVPDALRSFMESTPAPRAAEAPEQPAARAAAGEPPIPSVPAALRPYTFDVADEAEDAPEPGPFTLPLRSVAARPFDGPPAANADADATESLGPDPDEAEAEAGAVEPEADGGYSSLLAMKNPFRPREEFVRIDEPEPEEDTAEPAVVFPGQYAEPDSPRPFEAPQQHRPAPSTAPERPRRNLDPVETERALRSALATLQRMGGTG